MQLSNYIRSLYILFCFLNRKATWPRLKALTNYLYTKVFIYATLLECRCRRIHTITKVMTFCSHKVNRIQFDEKKVVWQTNLLQWKQTKPNFFSKVGWLFQFSILEVMQGTQSNERFYSIVRLKLITQFIECSCKFS